MICLAQINRLSAQLDKLARTPRLNLIDEWRIAYCHKQLDALRTNHQSAQWFQLFPYQHLVADYPSKSALETAILQYIKQYISILRQQYTPDVPRSD